MLNNFVKICLILSVIYSCNQNKILDKFIELEKVTWNSDSLLVFTIFSDESSEKMDFMLRIRYNLNYNYQNLYYNYTLLDSLDTLIHNQLREIILFDEKNGRPIGNGISSVFTLEERIINNIKLKKNNLYKFHIRQMMREDNLKGINSIGLIVKKNN